MHLVVGPREIYSERVLGKLSTKGLMLQLVAARPFRLPASP